MKEYDSLEELMMEKSFEELSRDEQSWVEALMSVSDYEVQRATLLVFQTELANVPDLPQAMEGQLMEAFREEHVKVIPMYSKIVKSIMAVAAMALFFQMGRWSLPVVIPNPTPEVITSYVHSEVHDTVYVDRIETIAKTIIQEKVIRDTVFVQEESPSNQTPSIGILASVNPEITPLLELEEMVTESISVEENEEIYELLVDVY